MRLTCKPGTSQFSVTAKCAAGSVVPRCTVSPRWISPNAWTWPIGWAVVAWTGAPARVVEESTARNAGRPTVSKARNGTRSCGKSFSACGISSSASCPRASIAQATASLRSLAWNTPLTERRWLFKPNSCKSCDVRAAFAGEKQMPGRVVQETDGVVLQSCVHFVVQRKPTAASRPQNLVFHCLRLLPEPVRNLPSPVRRPEASGSPRRQPGLALCRCSLQGRFTPTTRSVSVRCCT